MVCQFDSGSQCIQEVFEFLALARVSQKFIFCCLSMLLEKNGEFVIFLHVCVFVECEDALPGVDAEHWVEARRFYVQIGNDRPRPNQRPVIVCKMISKICHKFEHSGLKFRKTSFDSYSPCKKQKGLIGFWFELIQNNKS